MPWGQFSPAHTTRASSGPAVQARHRGSSQARGGASSGHLWGPGPDRDICMAFGGKMGMSNCCCRGTDLDMAAQHGTSPWPHVAAQVTYIRLFLDVFRSSVLHLFLVQKPFCFSFSPILYHILAHWQGANLWCLLPHLCCVAAGGGTSQVLKMTFRDGETGACFIGSHTEEFSKKTS